MELGLIEFLLQIVYSFILVVAVSFWFKALRLSTLSLFGGLGLFVSLVLWFYINQILSIKPLSPDNYIYASIIRDFFGNFEEHSLGVKFYGVINFFPILLCFKQPLVMVVFNVFYYVFTLLLISLSFNNYQLYKGIDVSRNLPFVVFLCGFTYPIAIIIIPTLLREASLLFALSIFLYVLSRVVLFQPKIRIKNISLLFVLWLTVFLQRPIIGVSLFAGIGVVYFLTMARKTSISKVLKLFSFSAIALFVFNLILSFVYDWNLSIDWLASFRMHQMEVFGDNSYGGVLDWNGVISPLKNLISLFFQYLLSPLPILFDLSVTIRKVIPTIDAIFILFNFFILLFVPSIRKHWEYALFAVIMIFIPSIFEYNIDGAFRHRMTGVVVFFPLFAMGWIRLFSIISKMKYDE